MNIFSNLFIEKPYTLLNNRINLENSKNFFIILELKKKIFGAFVTLKITLTRYCICFRKEKKTIDVRKIRWEHSEEKKNKHVSTFQKPIWLLFRNFFGDPEETNHQVTE
jgi:hypothetical protein